LGVSLQATVIQGPCHSLNSFDMILLINFSNLQQLEMFEKSAQCQ
jgi:hypothetical protein